MMRWLVPALIVAGCSSDEALRHAPDAATESGGASGGSVATGGSSTGGVGGTAAGGAAGAAGTGASDASSGGGWAGLGATGGSGVDAGATAGAAGSSLDAADAGEADVCIPKDCGGFSCGPLDDGCGGSLDCACFGPASCIGGSCVEVAASFCGYQCEGEFTTLVKTIPQSPCTPCSQGGSAITFCTKPGIAMVVVNDGVCPAAHHYTQSFKDCGGTWWYGCIPD